MKKSLLLLVCVSMSYVLMAQETVKQREVGVVFSNLDHFGFTFKIGNEKSLWRFNSLVLSGGDSDNTSVNFDSEQKSTGFGVKVGREYRKRADGKLEFRYGADLSFSYSYSKSVETNKIGIGYGSSHVEKVYSPGVNLVFGFNYMISENLILGAEVLPYFTFKTGTSINQDIYPIIGKEVKRDISGFSYGFSSSSVLLSLTYRF